MSHDILIKPRFAGRVTSQQNSPERSSPRTAMGGASNEDLMTRSFSGVASGVFEETPISVSRPGSKLSLSGNDEIKGKLLTMWNNVKFGWTGRIRTGFSKEHSIFLLGLCYDRNNKSPDTSTEGETRTASPNMGNNQLITETGSPVEELATEATSDADVGVIEDEGLELFKRDFVSRLWFTYRREFSTINDSNFTSDCGWGCMIRSGQMLLAQAFIIHFLGRDWRWDENAGAAEDVMHRRIIRWFGDVQSKNSPFSIHTLVSLGKETGKKPGDWYGPASVAHLIRTAFKRAVEENVDLETMSVYVAQDCAVYIQDILDDFRDTSYGRRAPWQSDARAETPWKPLILFIPLRLGTERLNAIYGECLKTILSLRQCVGIIGGRPKHSLYFVGYQDDKLIHLDPHYCQDMVDVTREEFSVASFHCRSPRKMKLSKMDPCCCLGFYCRTRDDFEALRESVERIISPRERYMERARAESGYPMFVFADGRCRDQRMDLPRVARFPPSSRSGYVTDTDDDDGIEEFVLI